MTEDITIRLEKMEKSLKEIDKNLERLKNQIKDIQSLNITGIWVKMTKLSERIDSLKIVSQSGIQ